MTAWIVAAYFGIGFLVLVAFFVMIGPKKMWFMLNDQDPNEPAFGFVKVTTAERRRRDDDHFGAWLCVFFSLFLWPAVLAMGIVFALAHAVPYAAKLAAEGLHRLFSTSENRNGGDQG